MKTYIINPDNNEPVGIDEWRKENDPKRAQLLAIETEDGHLLVMSKSYLPGKHTFHEARKACAEFKPIDGPTFRCPTRKECIDIYDARFQGLEEAIKLTEGDFGNRGLSHWTGDRNVIPDYAAAVCIYYGGIDITTGEKCRNLYGVMGGFFVDFRLLALPVAIMEKPNDSSII